MKAPNWFNPSQLIFTGLLKASRGAGFHTPTIVVRLLRLVRRFLSRLLGSSLVRTEVGAFNLLLPFSHELPFILAQHPGYSDNIARVALQVRGKYQDLRIIDVGANVGDTVALIRKFISSPILCIDGDPTFFSILAQNAREWPGVSVELALLGPPSQKGRIEGTGGTGHFVHSADESLSTHTVGLSEVLRRHAEFSASKLLKIDTDGFDSTIIRHERDLLCAMRPVIFFEYDPYFFLDIDPKGFDVFETLSECGYSSALFFDNLGELFCSCDLSNSDLLAELHCYVSDKGGRFYWDICVFAHEDFDLFDAIRSNELARKTRPNRLGEATPLP